MKIQPGPKVSSLVVLLSQQKLIYTVCSKIDN